MRIDDLTVADVRAFWFDIEPTIASCTYLEDAAQTMAHAIYASFGDSVVLARVFVSVPFGGLPEFQRRFVSKLCHESGVSEELAYDTPVLALVGTHGVVQTWTDLRRSEGHVGIPLTSSAFVSSIPMISCLLSELGLPLEWIDQRDAAIVQRTLGSSTGLFYVEDAREALDHDGRHIIPARDFVRSHGIRTVLGVGGAYFGGAVLVLVMFCNEQVSKAGAGRLMALANYFKSSTSRINRPHDIFREPKGVVIST